jgi:uncharacterized protein Usg
MAAIAVHTLGKISSHFICHGATVTASFVSFHIKKIITVLRTSARIYLWQEYNSSMESSIQQHLDEQAAKIDIILASVKKTEKYFQLIFWLTIILFVLPLIGLLLAIPTFLSTYESISSGILY